MLLAGRDDQVPLYVVGQGKTVRKRGERLEVWSHDEGKISEARIIEISKVCLYGAAEITTPAMVELMQRNVPVLHFSHGGWFEGICLGMSHKNVELRIKPIPVGRGCGAVSIHCPEDRIREDRELQNSIAQIRS